MKKLTELIKGNKKKLAVGSAVLAVAGTLFLARPAEKPLEGIVSINEITFTDHGENRKYFFVEIRGDYKAGSGKACESGDIAYYVKDADSAYFNITSAEDVGGSLYNRVKGYNERKDSLSFRERMEIELYNILMKRVKQNRGLLTKIYPKKAFIDEFVNISEEIAKHHEPEHEAGDETRAYLNEIANSPETNSFGFSDCPDSVFELFKAEGYSAEDIGNLPSKERSEIAKKIYEKKYLKSD